MSENEQIDFTDQTEIITHNKSELEEFIEVNDILVPTADNTDDDEMYHIFQRFNNNLAKESKVDPVDIDLLMDHWRAGLSAVFVKYGEVIAHTVLKEKLGDKLEVSRDRMQLLGLVQNAPPVYELGTVYISPIWRKTNPDGTPNDDYPNQSDKLSPARAIIQQAMEITTKTLPENSIVMGTTTGVQMAKILEEASKTYGYLATIGNHNATLGSFGIQNNHQILELIKNPLIPLTCTCEGNGLEGSGMHEGHNCNSRTKMSTDIQIPIEEIFEHTSELPIDPNGNFEQNCHMFTITRDSNNISALAASVFNSFYNPGSDAGPFETFKDRLIEIGYYS